MDAPMNEEADELLQAMFSEHVDIVYRTLDMLTPPIHDAVEVICSAMLDEHKVLVWGDGPATIAAQALCALMLGHSSLERPGLPVLLLGADATILSASGGPGDDAPGCARLVQALGQQGDVLMCLESADFSPAVAAAVQAAHGRGMRVVLIEGGHGLDSGGILEQPDTLIRIPASDPLRIAEVQHLVLNAIAVLVETRLFGTA